MALKGTLKDFSVTDVFQLITQQQKTGVLTLLSKGEKAQVAFDNGMVVMAGSDLKRMDDLLGQRLVRSAHVTQGQLDEALDTQKETLQMVGQILVEKGHLEKEALRKALLLQVQEAVYRLLDWKEGNYDFEVQDVRYDKSLYTPLSTEYLLMEGHRILDEWPLVRKAIPTTDIVFRVKGKKIPKEEGVDLVPLEGASGLLPEQERILGLVDGRRQVQEIVDLSRLGELEATKTLSELLAKGLIEKVLEERPALAERKPLNIKAIAMNMMSFGLIAVVVILILSYATMTSRKFLGERDRRTVSIEHSLESLGHFQWERIRMALELYYLEHESYPNSLEELVSAGILRQDELTFPWERMYYYTKRGGEYILLQPKK